MNEIALLQRRQKKSKIANAQADEWRSLLRNASWRSWVLMVLTLLVIASAFRSLRIPVGGLQMHLYLLLLIPLFLHYFLRFYNLFPKKILSAITAFIFLFFFSIANANATDTRLALNEIVKIIASLATIFTCALMVKTKLDFHVAVIGVCIASTTLAILNTYNPGFIFGNSGEEIVANKNAFALYVLPALLLGSFMVLDLSVFKPLKIALLPCILTITVSIFASGNRAGWIGALLIGVIIFGRGRTIKALLLVSILATGTYYMLNAYIGTDTFEQRTQGTVTQKASDETRLDLFIKSFEIAVDNPLFGVSPQELPYELAYRLPEKAVQVGENYVLDSHNIVAFIVGSSGFPCLFSLALIGSVLWQRPQKWKEVLQHFPNAKDSHNILRSILILWFAQGMFTREILYHPYFNMGLGLSIGYCISQGIWQTKAINSYQTQLFLKGIVAKRSLAK